MSDRKVSQVIPGGKQEEVELYQNTFKESKS